MKRITATYQVSDIPYFKQQMLNWANRFNIFIFLDSHSYKDTYSCHEWMLGAGAAQSFITTANTLADLKTFLHQHNDWLFGHFNYDLKNHIGPLTSRHTDEIGFPDIFLFQPEVMITPVEGGIKISSSTLSPAEIWSQILATQIPLPDTAAPLNIFHRLSREEYLNTIHRLREHILLGDCYEINFCQEFFARQATINPLQVYQKLAAVSPTPFGGFYKLDDKYLLCASPERFLQKKGSSIISQPIKGTARRNLTNKLADEKLKNELLLSQKEKSENVMVVDLVRNDLSRVCTKGSVQVEELFGVYSFPQVHQLISTITGKLNNDVDLADILKATFPMGSMTGAPKRSVMELTERYEKTKRGIYSGSIGYITPEKDFDFNVVIRSIMYNQTSHYLSYQVGGGITFYSDPEQEYEECMLKAAAIKKVLQ